MKYMSKQLTALKNAVIPVVMQNNFDFNGLLPMQV